MDKNDHIYIKKIGSCAGREVWLVDGVRVRRDLNDDFAEYGYHNWCKTIPPGEIWIEKETNEDEWKYFLENIEAEVKGLEEGKKREEMWEKADKIEQKDRRSTPFIRRILGSHHERYYALQKIRKHKVDEYSNEKLAVWIIDGRIVRALYRLEYGYGGHDLVYDFIPKGEVWIEEVLVGREKEIILLHELHERFLMSQGKDYLSAHHGATIVEMHYRKHPEGLRERLREEISKNNF